MRRPLLFTAVLLISVAAMVAGVLPTALGGIDVAQAASKNSLDLCVVEPGFANPGDSFGLTTTGPSSFNDTQTLQASACGSYSSLPNSGTYTVTQSQTPAGWSLAQIYCYSVGAGNHRNGTVDLSSGSASVKVNGATSCIFAELPGSGGGSGGGGFSGGTGSSSGNTSSTTTKGGTTTTTNGTSTTKGTIKLPPPIVSICVKNPSACKFHQ